MATAVYIVVHAQGAWWVDLNGDAQGSFPSLDLARSEAVSRAAVASYGGGRSEVWVSAPGHGHELVYQSEARSLLSRALGHVHP